MRVARSPPSWPIRKPGARPRIRREFGKGAPDGVLATESSNNATVGGGLIPTLVLGIPGTPPDAVILGALLVQGIRTGPSLFSEQSSIVYTFIYGLLLATVLMLPIGLIIGRGAFKTIVGIPKAVLVPAIGLLTVIGSFAIHNNVDDVILMVGLGVIGWLLNRFGYQPSPIVLGIILGPIAEAGFVQGHLIGTARGSVLAEFFSRPLSLGIMVFILLSLSYPIVTRYRQKRGASGERS